MSIRDFSLRTRWLGTAAFAILTSFLLAGCGGTTGGGVGTVHYALPSVPTTAVSIDSSSSTNVTKDALGAATGTLDSSAAGVSGFTRSNNTVKLHLNEAVALANKFVAKGATADMQGLTATVNCSTTGTIKVTTSGNDWRIDFNNCGDPALYVTDGSIAATNVQRTGTASSPPFSVSAHYSYDLTFTYNSGATQIEEMGKFDINFGDDGSNILTSVITNGEMGIANITTGKSIVVSNINRTRSCDSYDSSTWTCTGTFSEYGGYTVAGDVCGGSFTVTVPSASPITVDLGAGAQHPYSGIIQVDGAHNSQLIITVNDDELGTTGAAYDLHLAGDPDTTDTVVVGGEWSLDADWGTI
ncbi:MAG: hypothetical protein P8X48_10560 [Acidiferrobacteraceae bacterium]